MTFFWYYITSRFCFPRTGLIVYRLRFVPGGGGGSPNRHHMRMCHMTGIWYGEKLPNIRVNIVEEPPPPAFVAPMSEQIGTIKTRMHIVESNEK